MSGFENNTNTGRVEKMIDTLGLIEKSAKSNKADAAQISALLAPLMAKLNAMGVGTGETVEASPETAPAVSEEDGRPQTISDTKVRWEPTDREKFVARLTAREFVDSRPENNPQALMDLIYMATAELDTFLYNRGDTRGGKP